MPTDMFGHAKVRFTLKGMQVAQQLHRGQVWDAYGQKFVSWSIFQFHHKPKARMSLAAILMNQGLEMQLQGRIAGNDLKILIEARTQVQQYLQAGVIMPSASPFGCPILFVKKKDGTLIMVIDRAVNKMTYKDRYPLPRIDHSFDRLHGFQWFTELDLMSGYHQIRLREPDIPKRTFRTPTGHCEVTVLPFGLSNAPSMFQRIMNDTLQKFIEEGFVVLYLDDVVLHSKKL